uniref:Uncharacterized protein n=1 Tax=Esox lucius TaxID=8010 RepID=A0AAY5KQH0_ESOLU
LSYNLMSGLRLHDNPSLVGALESAVCVCVCSPCSSWTFIGGGMSLSSARLLVLGEHVRM